MPEFLVSYYVWWMTFFTANPVIFWVSVVVAVGFTIWARRFKRQRRW